MARRVYREHSLQIAVAHMLDVVLDPERTWWTAIDHGVGKLGFKEAGIRKARGVKRGIPDIIIMWADGLTDASHLIGIELKAGRGKASEAQLDVAAAWAMFGNTVFEARSIEEAHSILIECAVPMRTRMNFFSKGANDERVVRPTPPRHRRARRSRKSKGYLPLVLG
jgi:hypothetical protein